MNNEKEIDPPPGFGVVPVLGNLWAWGVNLTPTMKQLHPAWLGCTTRADAVAACWAYARMFGLVQ